MSAERDAPEYVVYLERRPMWRAEVRVRSSGWIIGEGWFGTTDEAQQFINTVCDAYGAKGAQSPQQEGPDQ